MKWYANKNMMTKILIQVFIFKCSHVVKIFDSRFQFVTTCCHYYFSSYTYAKLWFIGTWRRNLTAHQTLCCSNPIAVLLTSNIRGVLRLIKERTSTLMLSGFRPRRICRRARTPLRQHDHRSSSSSRPPKHLVRHYLVKHQHFFALRGRSKRNDLVFYARIKMFSMFCVLHVQSFPYQE